MTSPRTTDDDGRVKCHPPLSPRQRAIAAMLSEGMSGLAIAKRLGVSETTIKYHCQRASERLPGDDRPLFKMIAWYRHAPKTFFVHALHDDECKKTEQWARNVLREAMMR